MDYASRSEKGSKEQRAESRSGFGIRDSPDRCPKCGCDDASMLETVRPGSFFCNTCSYDWTHLPHSPHLSHPPHAFTSVDDLVNRTGIRRDELQTLADIGAFASFG